MMLSGAGWAQTDADLGEPALSEPELDALDALPPLEAIPGAVPTSTPSNRTGGLRVGNRTPFPIRVVLLQRRNPQPVPVHWDFAPGEGGSEGLVLSVQEREPLQLTPGDVIIAFALDGSRRYWGPNVVDETLAPFWDADTRVWTMIIQP